MPLITPSGVLKLITYVSIVREGKILLVQYVTPPNPKHSGWWIPAPECDFGEDPADRAAKVLTELGFTGAKAELIEVESFTGGAWHVIFHYRADVTTDAKPDAAYSRHGWFDAESLPPAGEFAHGGWERTLARRRIGER